MKREALHVAYQIKKAAVLGSGVMGSGIAAHLSKYRNSNIIIGYRPERS